MFRPRLLVGVVAVLVAVIACGPDVLAQKTPPAEKKKSNVPDGYTRIEVGLFVVHLSDEFLAENRKSNLSVKPMKALTQELNILYSQLGESPLKRVQRDVKIWVEWKLNDPKVPANAIAYYYSKDPRGPSVVITRMDIITDQHQPGAPPAPRVLLHEMAHALHDIYREEWDDKIKAAYQQAIERKLYHVQRGNALFPLYAATNHHDYFAELTCAYLSKLYYPPTNRAELAKYDPVGYKLLDSFWTKIKAEKPPPVVASAKADGPKGKDRDREAEATRKLELIYSRIQLGLKDSAKERLQELIKEFPKTEAAKEAAALLETLKM